LASPGRNESADEILLALSRQTGEDEERQVAVGVVVGVEEGELLLTVRGEGGRVEVEDQLARGRAFLLQEEIEKQGIDRLRLAAGDALLQAGEGGLGGEIGIGGGAAAHGDLEGGIGAQGGGVVGIFVTGGDLVDALTEQIEEGVLEALFEAGVVDAGGDAKR
jgi:hypothetical protein